MGGLVYHLSVERLPAPHLYRSGYPPYPGDSSGRSPEQLLACIAECLHNLLLSVACVESELPVKPSREPSSMHHRPSRRKSARSTRCKQQRTATTYCPPPPSGYSGSFVSFFACSVFMMLSSMFGVLPSSDPKRWRTRRVNASSGRTSGLAADVTGRRPGRGRCSRRGP